MEALDVAALAYTCWKGKEDTRWSQKLRHLSPILASFTVFSKSFHFCVLFFPLYEANNFLPPFMISVSLLQQT